MRIELERPHPDYPLGWVSVTVQKDQSIDPDKFGFDSAMVLMKRNITIIGPWETVSIEGGVLRIKAPVLLEDEHRKPRKRAVTKKTTAKKTASTRRK